MAKFSQFMVTLVATNLALWAVDFKLLELNYVAASVIPFQSKTPTYEYTGLLQRFDSASQISSSSESQLDNVFLKKRSVEKAFEESSFPQQSGSNSIVQMLQNFETFRDSISDDYDINLSHKLLSYHVTPLEISTQCYYNIYDKDEIVYLDLSEEFEILSSTKDVLLDEQVTQVKLDIEKDSHFHLLLAPDFGSTRRSCLLESNDIAKIEFSGQLVMATVEYRMDLVSKKDGVPSKSNYRNGKVLINFPLKGYEFKCLHGPNYCNLKTDKFSTNFNDQE